MASKRNPEKPAQPSKNTNAHAKKRAKTKKAVKAARGGITSMTVVLIAVAVVIAGAIIGYGIWYTWDKSRPFGQQNAQKISGVVNYRIKDAKMLRRNHVYGTVKYKLSPPVGGNHNPAWEDCQGDVYSDQIPNEHAVHALEHGAVWIAYNPKDVSPADVKRLADKVRGKDYLLMSPYPGLKSPISLQAWGFQLALSGAKDHRIDDFIKAFRKNANVEDGATCSGGTTITGTTPLTEEQIQQQSANTDNMA